MNCDISSLIVPKVIIYIIIAYFKAVFEWDPEKGSSGLMISNNNLTVKLDHHGNKTVLAKHAISVDECSVAIWEITIRDFPKYMYADYLCIAMGYVEYQPQMTKFIFR